MRQTSLGLSSTGRWISSTAAIALALVLVIGASTKANADGEPNDNFTVYLDQTLTGSGLNNTCTSAQLWQGSGNPATGFQIKTNVKDGVQLAIKAFLRQQGGDLRSTYVDRFGLVHVVVPSGSQVLPSPNPNRAKWNFTYSYDVSLQPTNLTLDNYEAELWIDLDPSEKTDYLKLKLAKLGPPAVAPVNCGSSNANGLGWQNEKKMTVIPDDEGPVTGPTSLRVTQNSQNLAFYRALIDADPNTKGIQPYNFGPGQFDVVMIINGHGIEKTVLHVVFDVVN